MGKQQEDIGLNEDRRKQLDSNIQNMLSSGASNEDVAKYAMDFKSNFGVKKKDLSQGSGNTFQNGQPTLPSGGITYLNSLPSGAKQPIDSEIPSVLTQQGRKPYIQEQIAKKDKSLQLSQDLSKYQATYEQAKGTPLAEAVKNIPVYNSSIKQGEKEPSFISKAIDGAGYIASGLTKGIQNIAKGATYGAQNVTGINPEVVKTGIDQVSEPFLPSKQTEARYNDTKIVSQLHGLAEFIPATLGAEATGGATFFLNGVGSGISEVDKMKKEGVKFDNGSDDAYIIGRGLVDWALMTRLNSHTIFSKLPSSLRDNVIKKLSMEAMGDIAKQGEKATGESILNAFKEKAVGFDTKVKQLGVNYLKSYANTAVDLTALNGANFALGKATNVLNGKDVFNQTGEDLLNSTKNILTLEAPIFAGFGGAKEVLSGQLFKKSPYRNEIINSLYKDATPENVDTIKQDLATHLQEKGLNEQEIANSVNFVDKLSEVTRTLPKTLSKDKFSNGVDLIIGRQELKDQLSQIKESKQSLDESIRDIPTKEEELVQAKLEQSNDKLQELVTGDKYKYKEDAEKGIYTKQLGNGKPEEISKDRYELEQIEKQFKTQSNEKTNEQNGELQNGQENGFKTQDERVQSEGKNDGQNEVQKEVGGQDAVTEGNIPKNNQQEYIRTDEQQQGQQKDRQYQEEPITNPKAEAGSSDSFTESRKGEEVKPSISSEKPADVSKAEDIVVGDITDKEYNNFIDNGKVEPERLNDIANKVKNREKLTDKENEIFSDKTSDINKIIANEQGTTIKETKETAQPIEKPTTKEQVGNAEDTTIAEPVKGKSFKESQSEYDKFKKENKQYFNKDGSLKDSMPKDLLSEAKRLYDKVFESLKQERESKVKEDKRDTGITDGINAIKNNENAYSLVKATMRRGMIGERLYNEFGKNLIHTNEKSKDLQTAEVASIISDFINRENKKPDDTLERKLQEAINKQFEDVEPINPINKESENIDKTVDRKAPVSKLQTAKEKLAEKRKALRDLDINLSVSADPKQKTKALYEYHSALVDVAKEYIKEKANEGIKTVEDFAKEIGEKVSKTVKDAWEEANGGNKLKEDDFLEKTEEEKIGLTKKEVQQLRNELGEEQYQYEVKERSKLEQQAQKMLDDGYNLKGLVERVKNGEIPKSDVEVELIRRYYGNLTDALNKNPTAELLKEKNDFLRATDLAKTETGRLVQAWDGFTDVKDDLADFLTEESKYADLSQSEITELTAKYKKAEEARTKLQEQVDKLTADLNNKKAIEAYAKTKRKEARNTARGGVKQAEKDYRKTKIEDFRNELRKIRNQTNAVIFPYQRELIALAPLVRDLTASYAREGVNDLKIVLRGIREELKNDIPELTEDDVRDILAGQYPNPKNTKNSKLAEIVDLQRQAKLELEIDNLQKGIVKEKSPVERKKKSDKVSELEREVKLLKQQHPELTYPEKLEDRKRFYKNQIEKIKDEIRRGEYDPLVEPQKIVLDQEALKLKDEWQNFKEETRERREKREDESRSKTAKAIDLLVQITELPRTAQTSIDFSIPYRQGIRIMLNPRTAGIGGRAYNEMIKSIFNTEAKGLKKLEFSEKNYNRLMFDIEHNPKFLEAKDDGLIFVDFKSINNEYHDENHRKNFLYKIPYLSAPFKASATAAAAWTNYARMELYLRGTRALEAQGKTRLNSKQAYEQMAGRILTDTGDGKIPLLPRQSRSEGESNVKKVLGTVLYGPKLVSSVIRRLNPFYYFGFKYNLKGDRVDATVRKEAAKDLVGYISAQVVLALVANQLGYSVSLNPDDSDFLKLRKGKEVIDVTGGESTAARTAFRLMNAIILRANPYVSKQDADDYSKFTSASVQNFWRNKLAPLPSYAFNLYSGTNSIGETFNPYDILKVYPMYTDDIIKAVKEDRIVQLAYVIPIGLSGLGYMQYQKDIRKAEINNYMTDKDKGLESFLKSSKLVVDGNINQEVYSNETGTMMPMTEQESDKFEKHWSEEVINGLKEKMPEMMEIKKKNYPEDKERKKIKQVITKVKTDATVNTQRFVSGVAKRDLTITEDDDTRELTSSEAQEMIKYINDFKKSDTYKSAVESYKYANEQLKDSGKQFNIQNEMQNLAVSYAKAKIKVFIAENKNKSNK